MFSRWIENGDEGRSPPPFHRFPAGYPQSFAQAFGDKSAENQRVFHMFCTRFPYKIAAPFFRSFYDANPKEIADSAGKKNGVNGAVLCVLRKKMDFAVCRCFPARCFDRRAILHNRCDTWNISAEVFPKDVFTRRRGRCGGFVFASSRLRVIRTRRPLRRPRTICPSGLRSRRVEEHRHRARPSHDRRAARRRGCRRSASPRHTPQRERPW